MSCTVLENSLGKNSECQNQSQGRWLGIVGHSTTFREVGRKGQDSYSKRAHHQASPRGISASPDIDRESGPSQYRMTYLGTTGVIHSSYFSKLAGSHVVGLWRSILDQQSSALEDALPFDPEGCEHSTAPTVLRLTCRGSWTELIL